MCRTQSALALLALCVGIAHSWDIVLSLGDQLVFYTNTTKTATVHFNSQNLAALAYDDVHNMILYVDKQSNNDAIGGYNLTSMESKYFTERNGRNIQGIAFDPATEKLFFSDTNERTINWISLKPGAHNNVYENRIIKVEHGIPTDIAVDSCRGYIYWITTNLMTPTIERARFDGSEREVVINIKALSINTTHKLEPHSLVIDQQTQNMFWVEATSILRHSTRKTDLNGQNNIQNSYFTFTSNSKILTNKSNVLTISKNSLISWIWCANCSVWEEQKIASEIQPEKIITLHYYTLPVGIAAHYKVEQQIQGLHDCEPLTSLVRNNRPRPFCVHGVQANGQSPCKCTPGYIGERCDVSVCENYCMQGNCSLNDDGLPTCSCDAGYIGERCEVNVCHGHCLNNGECSLNELDEPVCECVGNYAGSRCETNENDTFTTIPTCDSAERNLTLASLLSKCLNYCFQGTCSFNADELPVCSCNAGYSGKRCEVYACHGYCLNNGCCSLNEEDEPFCQCVGNHKGTRCEANQYTILDTIPSYSAERNF